MNSTQSQPVSRAFPRTPFIAVGAAGAAIVLLAAVALSGPGGQGGNGGVVVPPPSASPSGTGRDARADPDHGTDAGPDQPADHGAVRRRR